MSKIIRAVYDKEFPSFILHLDDGTGKPLCYQHTTVKVAWIPVQATNPTCTRCKRRQRAIEREPLGAA